MPFDMVLTILLIVPVGWLLMLTSEYVGQAILPMLCADAVRRAKDKYRESDS